MKKMLGVVALSLTLLLAPPARADLILQPATVSTNMGQLDFTFPDNVRNQSGLSLGYTTLVTDFDAYIASIPTHNSVSEDNIWASSFNTVTGNFDFALGGTFTIQTFALWNLGGLASANLVGFDLQADDNADFSSPTSLGSFTANPGLGLSNAEVAPQVFDFATPTSASFVRMIITSNNFSPTTTGFGEAAFEVQSSIPEPASLTLLGLGLAGLAGCGWRRRKRVA